MHCVIIGFAAFDAEKKTIYEYEDIRGEPHAIEASNINPYLVNGPNVVLRNRSTPICPIPHMRWGNKPTDGGHLILSPDEAEEITTTQRGRTLSRNPGSGHHNIGFRCAK